MEAPGLLSRGRLHHGSGLRAVGDLAYDLQSGGIGKLAWLANRDQERPGPPMTQSRKYRSRSAVSQVPAGRFSMIGNPLMVMS